MTDTIIEDVPLKSDYLGYIKIRRRNGTTGKIELATGLTGVEMFFSLTEGGSEINVAVRWPLTELPGALGYYAGPLDAASSDAYLLPLGVGSSVWKAIVKPGDVVDYRPCRLVWRRPD